MRIQFKKEWAVPAAAGVSLFAAGFGAGMLFQRRKDDVYIETLVAESMMDDPVPSHVRLVEDPVEFFSDEGLKKKISERIDSIEETFSQERPDIQIPSSEDIDVVDEEDVEVCEIEEPEVEPKANVFNDSWNWEAEKADRVGESIYILHQDEFFSNESTYPQRNLTYFEGDDILADENDVIVYGYRDTIGEVNFGHGTTDPDTFYVRNDKLKVEFEVSRHTGSYQTEILGIQAEEQAEEDDLKHSQRIPRFRQEY